MRVVIVVAVVGVLSACSGASAPIVDTKGVDMARYERDKAECEAYATQVSTGQAVGRGAAGGAVVGAAIGAITGNAGQGAGIGAVTGGAESARISDRERANVVRNCLRGRGYRVLN